LFVGLFPEDGGASFWRDDRVPGVLEHGDAVGDGDAECAAGAAFADDDAEDGDFEAGHFSEVDGDGFGLASFLGAESWVGAWGVDEGDDGEAEFFGFFHFGECFSVSFGVCAAEVAGEFFFGGFAFLVANDEAFAVADSSEAGDEGGVVGEGAVAMEFAEVSADVFDVVSGLGPVWMAGDADGVPGGEVFVDIFECLDASFFEEIEVFGVWFDVLSFYSAEGGDLYAWGFEGLLGAFDFCFDGGDWFFELELVESGHMCFLV